MKEKLQNVLGGFGVILYYVLLIIIAALPLVMIDVPFWADFLIAGIILCFPSLSLPIWIWGLVKAIQGPQDVFAIIYYVVTAVIYLPAIISIIIGIFKKDN